jgi:hypothetical protein
MDTPAPLLRAGYRKPMLNARLSELEANPAQALAAASLERPAAMSLLAAALPS